MSSQNDPSSVRILRPGAKVGPQLTAPSLDPEPEGASSCVFGVALETLREEGQMVCGVPLVLRDMVEFLERNGNTDTSFLIILHISPASSNPHTYSNLSPACALMEDACVLLTGLHHRGLFRLCSSVARTRQLRQLWDHGERVGLEEEADVPTVASLLKLFLRELPTPVVPEPQRQQLLLSLSGTRESCWRSDFLMCMCLKPKKRHVSYANVPCVHPPLRSIGK